MSISTKSKIHQTVYRNFQFTLGQKLSYYSEIQLGPDVILLIQTFEMLSHADLFPVLPESWYLLSLLYIYITWHIDNLLLYFRANNPAWLCKSMWVYLYGNKSFDSDFINAVVLFSAVQVASPSKNILPDSRAIMAFIKWNWSMPVNIRSNTTKQVKRFYKKIVLT